jgi:hypothetical protein
VAQIWQSRLGRLVGLAVLIAGLTQHGFVRWMFFGAFVVIVVVDVAWQERNRWVGR